MQWDFRANKEAPPGIRLRIIQQQSCDGDGLIAHRVLYSYLLRFDALVRLFTETGSRWVLTFRERLGDCFGGSARCLVHESPRHGFVARIRHLARDYVSLA